MDGVSSRLALFLVVLLLFSVGSSAEEPIFSRYTETLVQEPFLVGLLVSLNYLVYALLSGPGGRLCDRFGCRKLLLAGAALHPVAALLFFWAGRNIPLYVLASLVVGVGSALFWPAVRTTVAELGKSNHLGRAFGAYETAWSTGWSLGPLLGGFVAHSSGVLAAPFLLDALLTGAAALALYHGFRNLRNGRRLTLEAVREQLAGARSVGEALRFARRAGRRVRWLLATVFLFSLYWGMLWAFTPLLFRQYNDFEIGALLFGNSLTLAIAAFPAGELADRYGGRRVLSAGLLLIAILTAFYVQTATFAASMVLMLFIGAGLSVIHPSTDAVFYRAVRREEHGALSGFVITAGALGYAAGPILGGAVASLTNYATALLFGAALLALAALRSLRGGGA